MENNQAPQTDAISATPEQEVPGIECTFQQILFPTELRCFSYPFTDELLAEVLELANKQQFNDEITSLISLDHPTMEKFRGFIYDICQTLSEFKADADDTRGRPLQLNENLNYLPEIIGSNVLFQQRGEHIPLHCYEHVPLVFSFVLHTGERPNFTYYADTRNGVQTIRHKVFNQLVGSSFGLKARLGEVIVTPGYLQRYTETNLTDQTQVTFNVLVGFTNY
jgi:hypothetical protein